MAPAELATQVRRRQPGGPDTLSAHLRHDTHEAHLGVEASLRLDDRLANRETYAGLLLTLRRFYRPAEQAIGAVTGWGELTPTIDVASRRRATLIDDDLRRLGITNPDGVGMAPPAWPTLGSLAGGLGCLYVLEGSALGGQIVARRGRAALGEGLPVAFFSSAGRTNLVADWRTLRAAIDSFGAAQGETVCNQTVTAAHQSFAALREQFDLEARL